MPDSEVARHSERIAVLRTCGTSEDGLTRTVQALETAGMRVDVILADPQLSGENGVTGSRSALMPERASVSEYSAVVIPGLSEPATPLPANSGAGRFVGAMLEAGKPVLYVRVPAAPTRRLDTGGVKPRFDIKRLWADSWDRWLAINAPRLGAALAYYTLLSLAPLLVLMVSIAGVFFRRTLIQSGLMWQVQNIAGDVGTNIVRSVLDNTKSANGIVAGILSILTLLVGASGVFLELRDSLDTVWGVKPQYGSGMGSLVRERLFAFVMVLGTGVALSFSILVSAVLATPIRFLLGFLPKSGIADAVLAVCTSMVVLTAIFAMIYKVIPDIQIGWGDVWIGALVTAILFTAGKFLIGLYLAKASIGSAYAAAGSLIVFLTWVYYSVQIFLFGAEFTHEYALRHGSYSRSAVPSKQSSRPHQPVQA